MFLEARQWLLYKLSLLETVVEPASSSSAIFRMIATRDSKKLFNLAVTHAELKASGNVPGNLWYSEDTLARDNTGAGMLAQMINYTGISVQLINSAQDPMKYIHCVTIPVGSQKYPWGQQPLVFSTHKVCPLYSLLPKWVPGLTQNCLRNCLPFPTLSAPPCYVFLTSRGKQEELEDLKICDTWWRQCKEYILSYKHEKKRLKS